MTTVGAAVATVLGAFVITQSFVASSVTAGFVIGAISLWLVQREVADIGRKLDRQDRRIMTIEGTLAHMEKRRGSGDQ